MYHFINAERKDIPLHNIQHKRAVILGGKPSVGKSTAVKRLVKDMPQFVHFSMGDMLKDSKNPKILKIIAEGDLVSDALVMKEFSNFITGDTLSDHVILDGFCRTGVQANLMSNWLVDLDYKVTFIEMRISDSVALERSIGRGRDDDADFSNRLRHYKENQAAVFSRLYHFCSYHTVSAEGGVEEVGRKVSAYVLSDITKIDIPCPEERAGLIARLFGNSLVMETA